MSEHLKRVESIELELIKEIKTKMVENNISQYRLAEELNLTQAAISFKLARKRPITLSEYILMLKVVRSDKTCIEI